MHPIARLVLILAVAALAFWLVTKLRESTRGDKISFRPVEDLPQETQQSIDLALAKGKKVTAIKLYRQATKAPLDAAKAAIDVREWKRGA
jgi:ribosomal protein L7/L12